MISTTHERFESELWAGPNAAVFSAREAAKASYASPNATPQYAPNTGWMARHLCIELTVRMEEKVLEGAVEWDFESVHASNDPTRMQLKLEQVDLKISEVLWNGKPAKFRTESRTLQIDAPSEPRRNEHVKVRISYKANQPRLGAYFIFPTETEPQKFPQMWTQCQDEDAPFWMPALVHPNQKFTFEAKLSAEEKYRILSNGKLLDERVESGWRHVHYHLEQPLTAYLISVVVGEFEIETVDGPGGVPVEYWFHPSQREDGIRSFGRTPQMIEAFEKVLGVKYAYPKYTQVAVQDFVFGGMENTSATTQTDRVLVDERNRKDFSPEFLVAHELAHQWFGDLVTCRTWSEAWLNESFATFLERVWIENDEGPEGGEEEASYYQSHDMKAYLDEDSGFYRRPIVTRLFEVPLDIFDRHLYQKGGLILNYLRDVLSPDAFWASIRRYLNARAHSTAETIDLVRAFEDETGQNLRPFFDQWIYAAGHPKLDVSCRWQPEHRRVELTVVQKQTDGQSVLEKDGATTPVYQIPVKVWVVGRSGERKEHRLELDGLESRFFLSSEEEPKWVRFDPWNRLPKEMSFPRPKKYLVAQLKEDPDPMGRIEAAKELMKLVAEKPEPVLLEALKLDPFWGVRAEVAGLLSIGMNVQRESAMIERLGDEPHLRAKKAMIDALANSSSERVRTALHKEEQKSETDTLEAAAIRSQWKSQLKEWESNPTESFDFSALEAALTGRLERRGDTFHSVVEAACLSGLLELPEVARGDRFEILDRVMSYGRAGAPFYQRTAVINGLARLASKSVSAVRTRIRSQFLLWADEDNFMLQMTLVKACGQTKSSEFGAVLSKLESGDGDRRLSRGAVFARKALGAGCDGSLAAMGELRTQLTQMQTKYDKLENLVEELRARGGSPAK